LAKWNLQNIFARRYRILRTRNLDNFFCFIAPIKV